MKTVHIMTDPAVKAESTYPIYFALAEILEKLDIRKHFDLHDLGPWCSPTYRNEHGLLPRKSIDWFLEFSYNSRTDKNLDYLNTATLVTELQVYAMERGVDYSIFITNKYTNHPQAGLTYGATSKYHNSIFSLSFSGVDSEEGRKKLFNLAMHEFGHLFGLVLDSSRPHLSRSHCTNEGCIMVPFINIKDANGFESFCPTCLRELFEFANYVKSPS